MNDIVPNSGPATQLASTELIRLTKMEALPGHAFGFSQPCILAWVDFDPAADLSALARRLEAFIHPHLLVEAGSVGSAASSHSGMDPATEMLTTLANSVVGLQEAAGIPVARSVRIVAHRPTEMLSSSGRRLGLPTMLPQATAEALISVVKLSNALSATPGSDSLSAEHTAALDALMAKLRQLAPGGTNRRHLIRAALALGIPYISLPLGVIQFGWGKQARLFRSTETDETPAIGAVLARNKLATAAMLRMAGLPVPVHERAPTVDAALNAARRIGFPVVVKPVDLDKGEGVTAGLSTESEVRKAYEKACALSPNVMVEKHVEGQEYRLLVVHGRLFSAHERVPARVTGDGHSTIWQLINAANQGRRNGPSTGLSLVTISIAEEGLEMLEQQGQTLDSVPADGQTIRLQRVPNVTGGGDVRPVYDVIHPDNAAVAERAARLLRLDIAGIDFLTPDITRSWRDVGGKITEVNGQPQISPLIRPNMYQHLLNEFVHKEGRIPVALVLDSGVNGEMQRATQSLLSRSGIHAGVASEQEIAIGEAVILQGTLDPFYSARLLMTDPTVEAMVLFTDGKEIFRQGLPFDRFDLLVVANGSNCPIDIRQFLILVRPHLKGEVLLSHGDPSIDAISAIMEQQRLRFVKTPSDLAAGLCELLLAREKTVKEAS